MQYTTYAIGDVHGRADLLEPLLEAIEVDSASNTPRVIFLGDIVDRGPDSYRSMELVSWCLEAWPTSRLIMGNHDCWFLQFMSGRNADPAPFARWLFNVGGTATLQSYGLANLGCLKEVAISFREKFSSHLDVLSAATSMVEDHDFVYVHAGIDPHLPLDQQDADVLMKIRAGFLEHDGPLPKMVVHGHTPSEEPQVRHNRIGIDSGAYATGVLTCVKIEPGLGPQFTQSYSSGKTVRIRQFNGAIPSKTSRRAA